MDAKSFFILVTSMRMKQKEYFATRDRGALAKAKELEAKVDEEIRRTQEIMAQRRGW